MYSSANDTCYCAFLSEAFYGVGTSVHVCDSPGFLARNVHAKVGEPKFISIARTHHPHPSTLRGRFGTDATRTGLHGSDSAEAAERELAFWFPELVSGQGKIPLRILCCAEPYVLNGQHVQSFFDTRQLAIFFCLFSHSLILVN